MSILIDKLIDNNTTGPRAGINNENGTSSWVIAKNIELFNLWGRIKDAWRILTGKSRAYHFYEDDLLRMLQLRKLKKERKIIRSKRMIK